MEHVLEVRGLVHRYGDHTALSGVDLTKGYDYNALLGQSPLGVPGALAPQYGLEDIFNDGFRAASA